MIRLVPELLVNDRGVFSLIYETCCRYGHPEITKAFCDSDDVSYGNMHPKLIWGRTQTIGHGADCCNFKLTLMDLPENQM